MHKVLILGSLLEFTQMVVKAKQMGYYTIVCDGYQNGSAKAVADKSYNIDIHDVDAISEMCKKEQVDGIITSFSDLLFEQATKIAAKAGLKWYIQPDMLPYYRDKQIAKKLLAELHIPVPQTYQIDQQNVYEILKKVQFPLVLKPLKGYGSHGIKLIKHKKELISEVIHATSENRLPLYAEEYLHGCEYNMQTWVQNGQIYLISIADREKNIQNGNQIPMLNRVVYPAKRFNEVKEQAMNILQTFISATGQLSGPLSMQFFDVNGTLYVCEIAGRFFGYEHRAIECCSNLDLEILLLQYLYQEEEIPKLFDRYNPKFKTHCVVMYLTGKYGETVADVSKLSELTKLPYIFDYDTPYQPGMVTQNVGDMAHLGLFYLKAETREEADRNSQNIFKKFQIYNQDGVNIAHTYELNTQNY